MKKPLQQVAEILPSTYTKNNLLKEFQRLFPYQWNIIVERQQIYKEKAQYLYNVKKIKNRYNTKSPEEYFFSIPKVKHILSQGSKRKHKEHYIDSEIKIKKVTLEKKRKNKNREIEKRLLEAKRYTQKVDPEYLNIYMLAYHRKGITTEEKLEIITELKKFDTKNVVQFFRKLNDAEQNNMIRNLAFKHLQDTGYYVKLRKNFKGKKKKYQTSTASLDAKKPEDLYNDLIKKGIQSQKAYDVFISHSTKDEKVVEKTIKFLNEQNKLCYCDWTMDQDYLKRHYVGEYTKQVLKVRMEQSNMLVWLKTENSVQSDWVKFELEYFKKL
ncbi:toll/interleukin-1 receptor domain-containing protein, partial [Staphylococcus pseudintermedius]|nr:toll/interleukin-1 receptor domain-containing protein [Staphylococcus pseudintermedius]